VKIPCCNDFYAGVGSVVGAIVPLRSVLGTDCYLQNYRLKAPHQHCPVGLYILHFVGTERHSQYSQIFKVTDGLPGGGLLGSWPGNI
jgi:hypothetical protein